MSADVEWSVAALAEIVESAVDGPFGSNLKSEHYVDQPGVRVVRLQNVGTGEFRDDNRAWVSKKHAASLSKHDVRGNDVIVASLGDDKHPVGRACLYPADQPPGIVKADCFRLRLNDDAAPGFVMRALCCPSTRIGLSGLSQGVTRDRVNLGNLQKFEIRLPPLREQRRIAEILDTLDEAIRKTEEVIAKLEQMKQGLLHDLLTRGIDENGELRDPERHPEQFKDSPLGRIPREWESVPLGQVAEISNGTTPSRARPDYWGGGAIGWVASGKVNDYRISSPSESITERALADTSLRLLPRGTIVIGMIGQGKTRGMSARLEIEATINQNLAAAVPGPRLHATFAHHYLHWSYDRLRSGGRGSNQDALNCALVGEFPIVLPTFDEQERISVVLERVDERVRRESLDLEKLSTLKQGLMDDLLTGRVRVNVNEVAE